ncbi:conserved hypothetical protein [Altererythrobacter sp. B11]|nr:conserved hypothetical protein [Altererythrobacter sp. B11]
MLVLAPGLFAEDRRGLEQLRRGGGVLTLPAGPAIAAGFERIDLERAWAGALLVPGGLVERLADLPDDSNPFAALLRIGLQARLPERALSEEVLVEGSWSLPRSDKDARDLEDSWLDRHQSRGPSSSLAGSAALLLLRPLAGQLLARPRALPGALGLTGLAIAAAAGAAAAGFPAVGFLLLAMGAVGMPFCAGLAQLNAAPFGQARTAPVLVLERLLDLSLAVCGASAIEGGALHALFPPLVLVASLHAVNPGSAKPPVSLLGDRAVLSLFLASAAAFGLAEAALMLLALAVLAFGVVARWRNSG